MNAEHAPSARRKAGHFCLIAAPHLDGREIQTVERFSKNEALESVATRIFVVRLGSMRLLHARHALDIKALLETNPRPTREDIVEALSGNLCRCTGYIQLLEAVEAAAKKNSGHRSESESQIRIFSTRISYKRLQFLEAHGDQTSLLAGGTI